MDESLRDEQDVRRWRRARRRVAARRGLAVLPTMFTLGNLLCGFAAIFFASRPEGTQMMMGWTPLTMAAAFIFLGMIFDGLDGRIARLTRATSSLGEQLDSMADMVSFGVAPAFLVVQLARVDAPFFAALDRADDIFDRMSMVVALIYVACAALRLARFNIEVAGDAIDDHMSFKGLPSPGAAGTVASLVLLHQHFWMHLAEGVDPEDSWPLRISAAVMVAVAFLAAVAMVSRLRYVHVLNRYVRGRAKVETIAKAVIVIMLLLVHAKGALAGAFVVYALSAPVSWAWRRMRRTKIEAGAPPDVS
jgi:CDP-diacylglycerol--serine O-phosphatidyltransferase